MWRQLLAIRSTKRVFSTGIAWGLSETVIFVLPVYIVGTTKEQQLTSGTPLQFAAAFAVCFISGYILTDLERAARALILAEATMILVSASFLLIYPPASNTSPYYTPTFLGFMAVDLPLLAALGTTIGFFLGTWIIETYETTSPCYAIVLIAAIAATAASFVVLLVQIIGI